MNFHLGKSAFCVTWTSYVEWQAYYELKSWWSWEWEWFAEDKCFYTRILGFEVTGSLS